MVVQRHRVRHELTLRERLELFADDARRGAACDVSGHEREVYRKKVSASETAMNLIDYLARVPR